MSKTTKNPKQTGAANSVNFLISAIYTVSFGSAMLQIVHYDSDLVTIGFYQNISSAVIVCAAICVVLSLRFLFGNNNFMEQLFDSPSGTIVRLYHFVVTVGESLILLGSSFLVKKPYIFVKWIAVLFAIEVAWYIGCLLFVREATKTDAGRLDRRLLANEMANLALAVGFGGLLWTTVGHQQVLTWVACGLFVANTAVDFTNNMSKYMGVT